jgi:hypothetical protein
MRSVPFLVARRIWSDMVAKTSLKSWPWATPGGGVARAPEGRPAAEQSEQRPVARVLETDEAHVGQGLVRARHPGQAV